ncbi:hypothetical protein B0J15DRAFT_551248 [Fusarium solani]|uniref:Uncharacterized protein n=1 Tax=Fusarium solani TaxID=169388 RepID=A0A9P9KCU6_FUSSL|nr:uncharacterized protein B0J15DRAFT_551248 [Fusarium solani]KAH7248339.1 hypothetical protein B0J15DRAFT_551248 [Fusarium solani]
MSDEQTESPGSSIVSSHPIGEGSQATRFSHHTHFRHVLRSKPLDLDADGSHEGNIDTDQIRILTVAETALKDAHRLYSSGSLDRKMTQQRAKRLNEFRDTGGLSNGKPGGFRSFNNEFSLASYFRRTKRPLVYYYYRVVFNEDSHFTRENKDQVPPRDVTEPTP